MNKKTILIIAVVVIVAAGAYFYMNKKKTDKNTDTVFTWSKGASNASAWAALIPKLPASDLAGMATLITEFWNKNIDPYAYTLSLSPTSDRSKSAGAWREAFTLKYKM